MQRNWAVWQTFIFFSLWEGHMKISDSFLHVMDASEPLTCIVHSKTLGLTRLMSLRRGTRLCWNCHVLAKFCILLYFLNTNWKNRETQAGHMKSAGGPIAGRGLDSTVVCIPEYNNAGRTQPLLRRTHLLRGSHHLPFSSYLQTYGCYSHRVTKLQSYRYSILLYPTTCPPPSHYCNHSLGLIFPDFDQAPKRSEKSGYCGLALT